jgi:hypothetical protein
MMVVPPDISGRRAALSDMGVAFLAAVPRSRGAAVVFGFSLLAVEAAKPLVQRATVAPLLKPADVVSMLRLGSVAVGFAFRDIPQNVLAGSGIKLRARRRAAVLGSDVSPVKSQRPTALCVAVIPAQIDLPFQARVVLFHDQTDGDAGDWTWGREEWSAGVAPPAPRKRAAERASTAKA